MSYYLGLSVLASVIHHKSPAKQALSAEARHILSRLANRSLAGDDILRDKQGRPFFSEGGADFSISHSGRLAAVSLIKGNLRTGCDVELVRPRTKIPEIAKAYFCAPERDYIFHQGHYDKTRFYRIWTLKECFLKLRGQSVFGMAGVPSFIRTEGFVIHDENFSFDTAGVSPLAFYLYEIGGDDERYLLATAVEGTAAEPPEIRWFSEGSLSCRCVAKIKHFP